jgi:hypothetical protein
MTRPHHYVDCDVPEGMTLEEYRASKKPRRPRRAGLVARLRSRKQARTPAIQRDAA